MKYNALLFLLYSSFSIYLGLSSFHHYVDNVVLEIANKYINFTGKYELYSGENTVDCAYIEYLILKLYANMTGFTRSYALKLNLTEPSYIYLNCTASSSADNNSYIECYFYYEKYTNQRNLNLPDEFP